MSDEVVSLVGLFVPLFFARQLSASFLFGVSMPKLVPKFRSDTSENF